MTSSALLLQLPTLTDAIPADIRLGLQLLAAFIALLWGLELIDTLLLRGAFNRFGIKPRQLSGLIGIPLAPLLHGNLQHLAANTGPLAVLGSLVLVSGLPALLAVTAIIWLTTGIGVWLMGRPRTNHLGASGLVFGYLGFLLLRGYFERSPLALAVAILVGFLYSSALWGLLPLRRGRSWAGHLLGFVSGVLIARYWLPLEEWLEVNF